jgi:hypothetical protein
MRENQEYQGASLWVLMSSLEPICENQVHQRPGYRFLSPCLESSFRVIGTNMWKSISFMLDQILDSRNREGAPVDTKSKKH